MTKTITRLLAAAILCALPATADDAVTYEITNGKLTAIRGIYGTPVQASEGNFNEPAPYVNKGVAYNTMTDVEFVDGACTSIFSNCSDLTTFSGMARRIPRFIQTFLVDGITVDNVVYNFNSSPSSINGCSSENLCSIVAATSSKDGNNYIGAALINNYAKQPDELDGLPNTATLDTSQIANMTFARLTTYVVAVPVSPVPEPATWALMLAGLGLTGAALRRRRACFARVVTA